MLFPQLNFGLYKRRSKVVYVHFLQMHLDKDTDTDTYTDTDTRTIFTVYFVYQFCIVGFRIYFLHFLYFLTGHTCRRIHRRH